MFRSLLVPLDGSAFGEHSLPVALAIARHAGSSLHLAHVHQPVGSIYAGNEVAVDFTLDAVLRKREQSYLEDITKRVAGVGPVPTTWTVADGPIATAINEQALTVGADLIVASTHGRGPLSRLWLGSVADKLIRLVPMPILLMRPRDGTADLGNEPRLRRILVPLDGSPAAEQMLGTATALGGLFQAEYLLLRIIEPVVPLGLPDGRSVLDELDPVVLKRLEEEAESYLNRVAERLRKRSLSVRTLVVVHPSAAQAILAIVRAEGVDLIALETHCRGGLARLILGSVADKVLRGAVVPVLVHRPFTP